jgi:Gas vesicle protein G
MFILDSILIGSLRFVLDKIAAAAEAELSDDSVLREQLLEAQMRLELGEITEKQFVRFERDILARLRELKGDHAGLAVAPGTKVTGVEATVADELNE